MIFSAAGEFAMATLLILSEERVFLSFLGGQRVTFAALALAEGHHSALLAVQQRFSCQ